MDRELAAYHVEVEEFLPAGDDLLVLVKWRASGLTGVPVEQPMAFTFTICDGLTTRFASYRDRAEAFEAMGLPAPD